jgi:hypothetical protein
MIPIVELIRLETSADGTFGILRINKKVFAGILEPPDRLNWRNVSSIPAGQYICRRYRSQRFGETFIVVNVPGRSGILFHAGNRVGDTEGCLLVGEHIAKLRGDRAIKNSGVTFAAFMSEMIGFESFHFTITENY